MISLPWMFLGALVGLLVVAVFRPPPRKVPTIPTPDNVEPFFTANGCVKFKANEEECTPTATSLASKV